MLDLAKLQAHRFTVRHEEVDLERVLDQAYGAFTEEARRREIDYRVSGGERAPVIVSDGDRVLQIITNLLSNAFRWTPDGGRIELELVASNGVVSVDVLDSGPGVPPSQRKRIFEAFVSQDADGTGLGLPIARELAVALGGGIELRSGGGRGESVQARPAGRAGDVVAGATRRCRVLERSALRVSSSTVAASTRSVGRLGGRFEPLEPRIDAAPAGAHEIDEQREVVHPCMPLGEELALEPLEPPDRLVEEAADLGDVPRDGKDLGAQAVADRLADVHRDRRLELGGRGGECLDLLSRALEGGFDRSRLGASGCGVRDSLLRALQGKGVHGRRGYSPRRMDTALLDYELPPELVAQQPVEPRDASRLLVYRREPGTIEHRTFAELPAVLDGELVVVNDTRVVPGRLRLRRATGGAVEVLLVEPVGEDGIWEALVKPSSRLRVDEVLGPVRLVEPLGAGRWLVELRGEPAGEVPLPPYIHEALEDPERYQTVYASARGSAAAPTAGLHLTPALLARLDAVADHAARRARHLPAGRRGDARGARAARGAVRGERGRVGAHRRGATGCSRWERPRCARSRRSRAPASSPARTTLFITPGFQFRRVDALVTNFHLPRSTLLALVMAFVGVDETRRIYREAIAERYRFYSFGDAMAVL